MIFLFHDWLHFCFPSSWSEMWHWLQQWDRPFSVVWQRDRKQSWRWQSWGFYLGVTRIDAIKNEFNRKTARVRHGGHKSERLDWDVFDTFIKRILEIELKKGHSSVMSNFFFLFLSVFCHLWIWSSKPARVLQTERCQSSQRRTMWCSPASSKHPAMPHSRMHSLHLGSCWMGGS